MICKHVSTIDRGVVHKLRETIQMEIRIERKIYLIQNRITESTKTFLDENIPIL